MQQSIKSPVAEKSGSNISLNCIRNKWVGSLVTFSMNVTVTLENITCP